MLEHLRTAKKGAGDLTKQMRTMAGLTAVQNWTWWWFPHCFWKHVPQSILMQPSHSPLVFPLAPELKMRTAWDCKFKLNFGLFFCGGWARKWKSNVLLFPFQLCDKMSSLEEENENAIWMIYYSFLVMHFNFQSLLVVGKPCESITECSRVLTSDHHWAAELYCTR